MYVIVVLNKIQFNSIVELVDCARCTVPGTVVVVQ